MSPELILIDHDNPSIAYSFHPAALAARILRLDYPIESID